MSGARHDAGRRRFLKASAAAGGGFLLAFHLPAARARMPLTPESAHGYFFPNAFLRIGADDSVAVIVNKSEMGQGVYTSLPMFIAEELEADWSRIGVEAAPVAAAYNHTQYGMQMTGGSTSVASSGVPSSDSMARVRSLAAPNSDWTSTVRVCSPW